MRRPSARAYHEAGHAVVGSAVDRRVRSIRVDRSGLGGGRVVFEPAAEDGVNRALRDAAVALAGYLAHRRAHPGDRAYAVRAAQGDLRALAGVRIGSPLNLLLAGGRLAARILDQRWAEVERVAAALRPGRALAGQEIFSVAA